MPVPVARALTLTLDQPLELDPRVALRREPFGALAYHYGNRRLIFLKHPEVVAVVEQLGQSPSLQAALESCGVEPARWSRFLAAIDSLAASEVVRVRGAG